MFFNNKKRFLIKDLMEILGMTYIQLDNKIEKLINDGYVFYDDKDDFPKITDKALKLLVDNNLNDIDIELTYSKNIESKEKFIMPISLDKIYIPKNFDRKVDM